MVKSYFAVVDNRPHYGSCPSVRPFVCPFVCPALVEIENP